MIKASVNKGEVKCRLEGRGTQILAELTVLVDSVLDKMVDDDKEIKKIAVEDFYECLKLIN